MGEKKKLEPLLKVNLHRPKFKFEFIILFNFFKKKILIEWINSELTDKRVIVKDLAEDLYDGQILQMLIGNYILFYERKK